LIVLALLKAGEWGLIQPRDAFTINGHSVTPFGLSLVPFMIAAGGFALWAFVSWEKRVIARGGIPLMHPELLRELQLRNGLVMLTAQQTIIGGVFFVIPIYLQYTLLKNSFETGLKLAPMSVAMLIAAFSGPKLAVTRSPRQIVRAGLVLVVVGSIVLASTINPELNDFLFAVGMVIFGAGFGLVASQLGNVIMSSVGERDRGEAGGLQGTAQNIGTSIGVAMLGAVMIASMSSGVAQSVQNDPSLSPQTRSAVVEAAGSGLEVTTRSQAEKALADAGITGAEADTVLDDYTDAQIQSIRQALLLAALFGLIGMAIARRLPTVPGVELGEPDSA
jgi:Na+/melibiose symporter-like transporter